MERLLKCPLCKSGLFLHQTEIKDFAVSKENFMLCRCSGCNLTFTNPRPKEDKIKPYYDFPEYYSHEDKAKNIIQFVYQKIRNYAVGQKVKLFESLIPKGRILDYGCGTGDVLKALQDKDWKITGIEPNEKARKIANSKTNKQVFKNIEEIENQKKYDIISLFHVLEHIHELRKTTKALLSNLKKSGYLVIAVPNNQSWDALHYKQNWAAWDVPRHLYHFDQTSIEKFAEIFELEIMDIKPMLFDSFYVSMLSEKYQHPKQWILITYMKAILNGLKSNKFGNEIPGRHSSNIYILKKKREDI
jgi:2-polyprenyl-3-methyl-5-hydroxy-6-metoxy-1,4-benzoquinol methylase